MEKKRSVGITIIGILEILVGLLSLCYVINYFFMAMKGTPFGFSIDSIFLYSCMGLSLFLVLGIGIIMKKHIFWIANIFAMGIVLMVCIYKTVDSFGFPYPPYILIIPSAVIALSIIYYLTRPKVKEQFQ